jgi:copper resistance protein D
LAWFLGQARHRSSAVWISLARDVLPRFSHMGCAAVALLAATGAINSLLLVGSFDALVGTPYGRLLGLKILVFSVMVVLALINRFRLLPRLGREPQPSGPIAALVRSVLLEQALGFAVLAVVSILGTWPPAIHHHSG